MDKKMISDILVDPLPSQVSFGDTVAPPPHKKKFHVLFERLNTRRERMFDREKKEEYGGENITNGSWCDNG